MKVLDYAFGKVLIGQNAKENWKIIDMSEPDDMWFHLDNYPSCHIVAQTKTELTIENIEEITKLFNSRYPVCYTQIKNLTKNKNSVGSVFIKAKCNKYTS